MKKKKLLASWIMCPDGTMLPSFSRYDFREHITVDGSKLVHSEGLEEPDKLDFDNYLEWSKKATLVTTKSRLSSNDGGTDYKHRSGEYIEMDVFEDDNFEVIRRFLCRGNKGKDGKSPLTWVPLYKMDKHWLENVIKYNKEYGIDGHTKWYKKELKYRKKCGQ